MVVARDELGPTRATSYPGVRPGPAVAAGLHGAHEGRATQALDAGRRGQGSIFRARPAATGAVLTAPDPGRTSATWVACRERGAAWRPPAAERVAAILDHLDAQRATAVLRFTLAHPRGAFVFQPQYAASLTLIEPWWKILRSLALKGRRFETWEDICQAVAQATAYWNAHRHPFVWGRGRTRRRRAARQPGIAAWPKVA